MAFTRLAITRGFSEGAPVSAQQEGASAAGEK